MQENIKKRCEEGEGGGKSKVQEEDEEEDEDEEVDLVEGLHDREQLLLERVLSQKCER